MTKELEVIEHGNGALPEAAQTPAMMLQPTVLEQAAIAEIRVAAHMAMMRPRSVLDARDKILRSCSKWEFADAAIYEKPVGKEKIRGLSIRFCEEALRCYGNVKVQKFAILDDAEKRIVKICVWDLETGLSYSEDIVVRKTVERKWASDREVVGERLNTKGETVFIVLATDDELQNKEGAAVSKAIRNIGLRILPEDLQAEAKRVCETTIEAKVKIDPKADVKRVVDSFSSIGVRPSSIVQYLGHPVEEVSPAELKTLRGHYTAVAEGSSSWATILAAAVAERASQGQEPEKPKVARKKRGNSRKATPTDPGPPAYPDDQPKGDPKGDPTGHLLKI
ncbi:MAG: hypothetical protein ACE5F1_19485 [Planctomycetota bacterium]